MRLIHYILIVFVCAAILPPTPLAFAGGFFHEPAATWSQSDDQEADPREAIEKAAKKLFKSAKKNYDDKYYWSATADLILIIDFYSTFSQFEDAVYMLANSYYQLKMYQAADRLYRYLLRSVERTRLVPEAILGLQKVAYQTGDYQQSLKFYKALESHYTQHEGIYESRYYAEQTYFDMQNYNLVHNVVPHIENSDEFYPFALYSSGLAYLKKKTLNNLYSSFQDLRVCPAAIWSAKILLMRHA